MAGLLDNDYMPSPMSSGLLSLGAALMTPRELGGGIGPGLIAFQQGATQAQQMRRQMAQDEMQRKLYELKLGEAKELSEDRKRKRAQEEALRQAAISAYVPASPGSLGGGVTPGSQQGVGLMAGLTGGVSDEDRAFDAALLASDNRVLNENAARQGAATSPVAPPVAGGFSNARFVDNLRRAGMPLEAAEYAKKLQGDSPFAKIDPKDYTPESMAAFIRSGGTDMSVLRRADPVERTTPTEIEKLIRARDALPPGDPNRKLFDERIAALNYRQPPSSTTVSYGAPFTGVDPTTGLPMLYQPSNRGGAPIPTGLAPPPKPEEPVPENERGAAGYAGRMIAAERTLQAVGPEGLPTFAREIAADLPLTGGRLGPVVRTEAQQRYRQAQEDWVRAKLRKESGAAIGADEMEREIKTYFPQPGEPASLAAQKAQARQQAIAGMRSAAGRAPIPQAGEEPPQTFKQLPPARDYDGKTVRDTVSGKRYKSEGGKWVEVK